MITQTLAMIFASTMVMPEVVNHPESLTKNAVVEICQQRAREAQQPCAVVEVDDRVCFAFMSLRGESSTVHCFHRKEEKENGDYYGTERTKGVASAPPQAMVTDGPAGWLSASYGSVSWLSLGR